MSCSSVATIQAVLSDGTRIIGQNAISHPSPSQVADSAVFEGQTGLIGLYLGDDDQLGNATPMDAEEGVENDANIFVNKERMYSHPSTIAAIEYINSFGKQVFPKPNANYMSALHSSDVLVYSCGSLYTSIIPCLALRGVGRAIASSPCLRYKILLLNSLPDIETPDGTTAVQYLTAIQKTLNRNLDTVETGEGVRFSASDYV